MNKTKVKDSFEEDTVKVPEEELPRIFFSMTTSPSRLPYINEVLKHINLEDVYELHINLPMKYRDLDTETYDISDDFLEDLEQKYRGIVKIFRYSYDLGPLMKLIPTLFKMNDNDIIVTIDDDIVYPYNELQKLLNESKKYPEYIIAGKCFKYGDYLNSDVKQSTGRYCDVLEGWSMVLYKRSFFNSDIISEIIYNASTSNYCKFSDDFIISNSVKAPIKALPVLPILKILWYSNGVDALHNGSGLTNDEKDRIRDNYFDKNMLKYKQCYKVLRGH